MNSPVVVLDACVLVPIRLATTLLWLAEAGLFQPLWSEPILDEVQRNLPKVGVTPEQARRRVAMMRDAFGAEALIDGVDDLVDQMGCDPKDRHVLAAAVRGGADTVLTFNLKDFPDEAAAPYGIGICHPDSFLAQLLSEHTDTVRCGHPRARDCCLPESTRDGHSVPGDSHYHRSDVRQPRRRCLQ